MTSTVWAVLIMWACAFTAGMATALDRNGPATVLVLTSILFLAYIFWPEPPDPTKRA